MVHKISEVNPNEIIPGFLGKFFHGKNMTIAFWCVKKNSKIPQHKHIHEQCLYVKKGFNSLGEKFGDYISFGLFAGKTLFMKLGLTAQIKGEWVGKMEAAKKKKK